jgi:hypothetical protein
VTPADLTLPSAPLIDVVVGQTCDHHRMLPRLHLTFQNGSPQFAEIRLRAFLILFRDFVFCAVREEQQFCLSAKAYLDHFLASFLFTVWQKRKWAG